MRKPSLLCVANGRASTGYAWSFINEVYGEVGARAVERGMRALVAYRVVNAEPAGLEGSPAEVVELEVRLDEIRSVLTTLRFVIRERVRVLYLTDRATWSPTYTLLRLAGVRRIVVHDHSSGWRTPPTGIKRLLKRVRQWLPGSTPDAVIGVSEFVTDRLREVGLVPAHNVHCVRNSIHMPVPDRDGARRRLREAFDIDSDRPIVASASRSEEYKGIRHLLLAFDRVARDSDVSPVLIYFGEGPALEDWRGVREGLASRDSIILAGYRTDAADLMAGADIAVVPSTWAEAFGLAALEPMSHGVPVIASEVGGLQEVVGGGETGLLVPPGDEGALAGAMSRLLSDPAARDRMGRNGIERAHRLFARGGAMDALEPLVLGGERPVPNVPLAEDASAEAIPFPDTRSEPRLATSQPDSRSHVHDDRSHNGGSPGGGHRVLGPW